MANLRPSLRWLLLFSAAASALAIWWPESEVREVQRTAGENNGLATNRLPAQAASSDTSPILIPIELPRLALKRARFDPFVGVVSPPPPAPKIAPAPIPAVSAAGPASSPAPQPPTINYRFLGQMIDPLGKTLVYLVRNDVAIQVGVGSRLEGGFTVESIDSKGVGLHYAPLDARVVIPIPPVPQSASR